MDLDKAKAIMADLQNAVKAIEEKYGVVFANNNVKYDSSTLSTKITLIEKSTDSKLSNREEMLKQNLIRSNTPFGKEHIGVKVSIRGQEYSVIGMSSARSNAKVIIKSVKNGGNFEVRQEDILKQLIK